MNLGWKGFRFSSYTPDKSHLLNYLASGTFWEVFELNEVCLREMLCLLSSLVRLLWC
ncbi:hypothetical protein VIBAE_B10089 [Vibrio aestuarianus subsp. francensis]|nr:hypothetical protein VIBAE_B10089 [Vibrio aestuarianus subsp. francensis]